MEPAGYCSVEVARVMSGACGQPCSFQVIAEGGMSVCCPPSKVISASTAAHSGMDLERHCSRSRADRSSSGPTAPIALP